MGLGLRRADEPGESSWVRTSGQANRGSVMGLGYRPPEGEVNEAPS